MLEKYKFSGMLFIFNYFQFFIIGACMGSFLNVVIYRFQNNLSIIKPRSFCPKCKNVISIRENIPLISYLIQKGKCLSCNQSISLRYPLVELITGILFAVFVHSSPSFYSYNSNFLFNTFYSWLFLSILISISLIDIDSFWIPQGLINFGFASGILGLIYMSIFNNDQFINGYLMVKGLSTAAISYGSFELLRYFAKCIFKKDAIGKGDSKLVAMLALWLGPLGILFAVGISYIIASIYCLIGLFTNLVRLNQVIPFGPFLSLGGLLVWLLGNDLIIERILRI